MSNPITWVEIPVKDMDRAMNFYNQVMGWKMTSSNFGGLIMGWFPFDNEDKNGSSGALVQHEDYSPSETDGPVVYFTCDDVQLPLSKVKAAGGKILREKVQISPEHGYMGLIVDTEGNRVAFHSLK